MPKQLTCEQAKLVDNRLGPVLGYLNKMLDRMHIVGFAPQDKLMRLVVEARDAMHGLCVELHYQSCGHGVGKRE
jgi:hypothetical protein